jgi:bacterioferritin-associated ferredoxin
MDSENESSGSELICYCACVSRETIEQTIREIKPTSVDEVSEACSAGSGCGSCRKQISAMIKENLNYTR